MSRTILNVGRISWVVAILVVVMPTLTFAQYPNRYSSDANVSSSTTQLTSTSPSKRSGYSHSAMSLGMLHSEGYDDLASFRPTTSSDGKYRKPKSIERIDASTAVVGTALGGELFELNLTDGSIRSAYTDDSRSWSKLLAINDQHLAAIDVAQEQVVIFQRTPSGWKAIAELVVPGRPHSLTWDQRAKTLYVTGQWSQRLFRFSASPDFATWQTLAPTNLPMHGGALVLVPSKDSMIVMDAFGGDYVVLSIGKDQQANSPLLITHQAKLYAQNIPSLQLHENEARVLFPFQLLNPETYSVQGDITWGGMISNNLRLLSTDRMLTLQGDEIVKQSRFIPIGEVGNGAGDPNSLRIAPDGTYAVTLGGIDHVAVGRLGEPEIQQIPVGLHPVDSVFSSDGRRLFVVNEFCDSLSFVDLESGRVENLPLGPLREPTLAERGERLFFHSKLAHDGWMSCHSCHSQGHTSGSLNDNTSDGSLGTPKRILSLLGQAETAPYSWGGEITELEQQVLNSLQSTMATDHQIARSSVEAITAFVRTLPAPPSIQAARNELASAEHRANGRALFEQLSCNSCHAGAHLTSIDRFDVNLHDEHGQKEFNPPSLIGVSQRSRSLFHDGRATSIEEVLVKYKHQLPRELDPTETNLLVDYLKGL